MEVKQTVTLVGKVWQMLSLAVVGMAVILVSSPRANGSFPNTDPTTLELVWLSDLNLAQYSGRFDTSVGEVVITAAKGKLIALTCGEQIELFPHASIKDRFEARSTSVTMTFGRDRSGKVNAVTIIIPGGAEVRGQKIK